MIYAIERLLKLFCRKQFFTQDYRGKFAKNINQLIMQIMKNKRFRKLLFSAFIICTVASCDVEEVVADDIDPINQNGMKSLVVDDSFDWSTSKDYTINFKGNPIGTTIERPLEIKIENGDVIRRVNISLSDNVSINLRVPSKDENLILSWGSLEKTLTLEESNTIDFTFIEPDVDEEE